MSIHQDAIDRLTRGNARFAAGESSHPNLSEEWRHETYHSGQTPFVGMLSCADSRAPIEIIFDQGIGDIFSVRNAGNIYDDIELGSLEIGVFKFNIPLLIVLGHTDCGAIRLAVEGNPLPGSMQMVIDKIIPNIEKVKKKHPHLSLDELIAEGAKANALHVVETLKQHNDLMRARVDNGELKIIAGLHHLKSGLVEWLD